MTSPLSPPTKIMPFLFNVYLLPPLAYFRPFQLFFCFVWCNCDHFQRFWPFLIEVMLTCCRYTGVHLLILTCQVAVKDTLERIKLINWIHELFHQFWKFLESQIWIPNPNNFMWFFRNLDNLCNFLELLLFAKFQNNNVNFIKFDDELANLQIKASYSAIKREKKLPKISEILRSERAKICKWLIL